MTSPLPSPPTSPRTAATTRIRIKPPKGPGQAPSIPGSEGHTEPPTLSIDPDVKPAGASVAAGKRRQPSITYYTPSSPSPWSQRPQPNRTLSSGVDGPRDDPVAANAREAVSKRSSLVLSSRPPSTRESMSSSDGAGTREPLTLVEKHADLLHFIAQKERKCLELRDQLAAHEKELAELKRKWERVVNRGHDPQNPPPTAGIGGVALDGLKEGVRMIAAGFSDLGGVIHELESADKDASKSKPSHDSISAATVRVKRTSSLHLPTNSTSSIQRSVHASVREHVLDDEDRETMMMAMTVATAPSLSRANSLNYRMHKRASRSIPREPSTPTSTSISPPTQSPTSANPDMGMSLILTPSPTFVPHVPVAVAGSGPMPGSTTGPMSWMDNVGKKLSGLQRGQTFSKGQKRASVLLAGVSSTISSALSPGPTATTPAPVPASLVATTATRVSTRTIPPSTKPLSARPHPTYESMADWLDDDEEQTVHVKTPVLQPMQEPRRSRNGAGGGGEKGVIATPGAPAVSSFDDDDWNW